MQKNPIIQQDDGLIPGPEHREKLKLEEQLRAADEMLKYKKRQIQELQQDLEVTSVFTVCV